MKQAKQREWPRLLRDIELWEFSRALRATADATGLAVQSLASLQGAFDEFRAEMMASFHRRNPMLAGRLATAKAEAAITLARIR